MTILIVQAQQYVGRDRHYLWDFATKYPTDRTECYACQMWAMKVLLTEALTAKAEALILRFRVASRVDVLVCLPCLFVHDHTHSLRPNEDSKLLLRACALVHDVKIVGQG